MTIEQEVLAVAARIADAIGMPFAHPGAPYTPPGAKAAATARHRAGLAGRRYSPEG